MNIIKSIIILVLVAGLALAQNNRIQVSQTADEANNRHKQLALEWEVADLTDNGLIIQLPEYCQANLITVQVADQKLWLKKSDRLPQAVNQIHWQRLDHSTLLLRFYPGQINTGQQLTVQMDVHFGDSTDRETPVVLRRPASSTAGEVAIGDELDRYVIETGD